MKPLILVAAVVAFEFAFVASIATPPTPAPQTLSAVPSSGEPGQRVLAQRAGEPVPCTPRG
jgi:hypothetical protein